jgi:hypothetical protein
MKSRGEMSVVIEGLERDHVLLAAFLTDRQNRCRFMARRDMLHRNTNSVANGA